MSKDLEKIGKRLGFTAETMGDFFARVAATFDRADYHGEAHETLEQGPYVLHLRIERAA